MEVIKARALLCAIKNRSLKKAAEELDYTPSAMSHMADSIEDELKVKILVRTPKGISLTKEGEILLPFFELLVKAEDDLIYNAESFNKNKRLQLNIATYSSISLNLLPPLLKEFKKQHPEISVSITVENQLSNLIDQGKADIIITDGQPKEGEWCIHILDDPFVAVTQKNVFEQKTRVSFNELYPFPFIKTQESALNSIIDLGSFKEVINFSSVDDLAVLSMIKEGLGISILPLLAVKKRSKGLKLIKTSPEIIRSINIVYPKDIKSEGAKKFITFFKKESLFK
jgi:DNA-binding transcriptional LysR family regulator